MTPQTTVRPPPPPAVDRCTTTRITKPECHRRACLAALVASHHRRAGTA